MTVTAVYIHTYLHTYTYVHTYVHTYKHTSRLTIVSREAKKKQAVHDERVSYLHVALL